MVEKKSSNRWQEEHEALLLRTCSIPENKPIGGESDGQMVYANDVWGRIHEQFMQQLPAVNERLREKRTTIPRVEFDKEALRRRFRQFNERYQQVNSKIGVYIRPPPGSTGSCSDGQPPEDKCALARAEWHLWQDYHEAFGLCARVRPDAGLQSMQVWKPPGASDKAANS
jgi:hypothetical protein